MCGERRGLRVGSGVAAVLLRVVAGVAASGNFPLVFFGVDLKSEALALARRLGTTVGFSGTKT